MSCVKGIYAVTLLPGTGYGDAACEYLATLKALGYQLSWNPVIAHRSERATLYDRHLFPNALAQDLLPLLHREIPCKTLLAHVPPAPWTPYLRGGPPVDRAYSYIAWEVARVPDAWHRALEAYEKIFVPSTFTRDALLEAGLNAPLKVIPHIWHPPRTPQGAPPWAAVTDGRFVFYTIGTWTTRKALEETVRAYLETFTEDDEVVLVVKTEAIDQMTWHRLDQSGRYKSPPPPAMVWWRMAQILGDYAKPAKVHLVAERVPVETVEWLHARGNCYLSLAHSEGWGLGAFGAALAGTPVVITGWGGQIDYLGQNYPLLVRYELEASADAGPDRDFDQAPGAVWARADRSHANALMRQVAEDPAPLTARARELGRELRRRYAPEKIGRQLAKEMGLSNHSPSEAPDRLPRARHG